MPIASIIIATFNHASVVREAIDSALAQTVPCEVIVVDDGSTDETAALLLSYGDRIRSILTPHRGVSAARNKGLALATGEYVMFLDADDVIAPAKVVEQAAAFDESVGWVICDVQIDDAVKRVTELASQRYRYPDRELGGWVKDQLLSANFIPLMSPLVRRSVAQQVRFPDLEPEDWHYWTAVAELARMRYLPHVLATYRKGKSGRSRSQTLAVAPAPAGGPLLLNLGCGTPGALSWHPMPGCVNLDRSMGWRFEDGLGQYADGSVDGITVSHAAMYIKEEDWPFVLGEFRRVLRPGGVLRITEDDTVHRDSKRRGGWQGSEPAITLTSPAMVRRELERAGFAAHDLTAETTTFVDRSLMQAQHGSWPDVFFMEGVNPSCVLFAPHADDETLFASFTIQAHRPAVVVCFPSTGDYGDTAARLAETRAAVSELGGGPVTQWTPDNFGALVDLMRAYDTRYRPARVWAPHIKTSHADHVQVAQAAQQVFGARVSTYHTYDTFGKVKGEPVPFEPAMVSKKLRALACYQSQIAHPRARAFFVDADLHEYAGETR